jgi:hypothetical protein
METVTAQIRTSDHGRGVERIRPEKEIVKPARQQPHVEPARLDCPKLRMGLKLYLSLAKGLALLLGVVGQVR